MKLTKEAWFTSAAILACLWLALYLLANAATANVLLVLFVIVGLAGVYFT